LRNDWASPDFIIPLNFALKADAFTNHQLLGQRVGWQLLPPYELLVRYKERINKLEREFAGRKKTEKYFKILKSLCWSNLLNDVRTHFAEKNGN
jgi:hypothetical protein